MILVIYFLKSSLICRKYDYILHNHNIGLKLTNQNQHDEICHRISEIFDEFPPIIKEEMDATSLESMSENFTTVQRRRKLLSLIYAFIKLFSVNFILMKLNLLLNMYYLVWQKQLMIIKG